MRSGTLGVCLNFAASAARFFSADMICRGEDVLVRLVKLVDFAGGRQISTPRATLPRSLEGRCLFYLVPRSDFLVHINGR